MSYKLKQDLLTLGGTAVSCKVSGGVLRPAVAAVNQNSRRIFSFFFAAYSPGAGITLTTDGQYAYTSTTKITFSRIAALAGDSPFFVEEMYDGKTRAALISGANALFYRDMMISVVSYGANLSCGAMHCGRLFGADADDKLKLCWSGEGGICDWEEKLYGSGSLHLDPERGNILDILVFNGRLVAVREFGLTVLNMFGSPENFSVAVTDTDTAKVIKGTAKVAGGVLFFCTADGLCSFDGTHIKSVVRGISPHGWAESYGNKYFLICEDGVLCYDTDDGKSYLIDVEAEALCAGQAMYAYSAKGAYKLCEDWADENRYTYESDFNFGTSGTKTVTKIWLDGNADLELSNGRVTRKVAGVHGVFRPNFRGESFTLKVTGSAPIKSLAVYAEVRNAI